MCPFVETADSRCGRRLTLDALSEALGYCAGEHRECPVYREIQKDARTLGATDSGRLLAAG
jgi:hypothetical protein